MIIVRPIGGGAGAGCQPRILGQKRVWRARIGSPIVEVNLRDGAVAPGHDGGSSRVYLRRRPFTIGAGGARTATAKVAILLASWHDD